MLHYLIELAVWLLASYFAGACVYCLLRQLFGSDADVAIPATAVAAAPVIAAPVVAPRVEIPRPVGRVFGNIAHVKAQRQLPEYGDSDYPM